MTKAVEIITESLNHRTNVIPSMTIYCQYCGHTVKTERGLRQHIDSRPECRTKELAKAGLFDVSKVRLKPPPVASIPKRTCEESDSNHNFDHSKIGYLLGPPKAKRSRRFGDYEARENGGTGKTSNAVATKILGFLDDQDFQNLLDEYRSLVASGQEMSSDNDEQEPQVESSSEGELTFVGGQYEDENSEAEDQGPDVLPPPPDVPPPALDVPPPPPGVHVPDYNNDLRINIQPNTEMLAKFKEYCRERKRLNSTFSIFEKRNINI